MKLKYCYLILFALILPVTAQLSRIDLDISGELSIHKKITPQFATLGGKDIVNGSFSPGKYGLVIEHPGYERYEEEIIIPENTNVFVIKKTLKSKPRLIKKMITYEIDKSDKTCEVVFTNSEKSEERYVIEENSKIPPGLYHIQISQQGYITTRQKRYVVPADEPFFVYEKLKAQPVEVKFHISYNVRPKDREKCCITFSTKNGAVFCQIGERGFVTPGKYQMTIQRSGYEPIDQMVEISNKEKTQQIWQRLYAKPRMVNFGTIDSKNKSIVFPDAIINTDSDEAVNFNDVFYPGEDYHFQFVFKEYKSFRKKISIPPGEGPYTIELPLEKLQRYDFVLAMKDVSLNGIVYPVNFELDGVPLSANQYEMINLPDGNYHCQIWADSDTSQLKIAAGYQYEERYLQSLYLLNNLPLVDISALIQHLEKIAKIEDYSYQMCLDVLEDVFRKSTFRRYVKSHPEEIEKLRYYISKWELLDFESQQRTKVLLSKLNIYQ